jgi:hypothetical protein
MDTIKYAVMVEGKQTPSKLYDTFHEAEQEARRLARSERRNTYILKAIGIVELSDVKVTMY